MKRKEIMKRKEEMKRKEIMKRKELTATLGFPFAAGSAEIAPPVGELKHGELYTRRIKQNTEN